MQREFGLTLAHALLGFLLALVPMASADDWETAQHDLQRTGLSASTLVPNTLQLTWTAPSGFTQPIIVGGNVLAIQNQNIATAPVVIDSFNIANGSVNWSTSLNYSADSGFAYGSGYVACVSASTPSSFNLDVLSATTGAFLYSVPIAENSGSVVTIATDPSTGLPDAYVSDGRGSLVAIKLGASSGTTLWTAHGIEGGEAVASVDGNLLFVAGTDNFNSINRSTGAVVNFHNGGLSGGGAPKVVVDQARNRLYVSSEAYINNSAVSALYGFSINGSSINQLWQQVYSSPSDIGTPAIDSAGNVYFATDSALMKINGATGAVLAQTSGSFYSGNSPIVTGNYVWEFGSGNFPTENYVYNLNDLSLAAQFEAGPLSTYLEQSAAIDNTHLIEDFGGTQESPGFEVFTGTPEPGSVWVFLISVTMLGMKRRRA